MNARVVTVWAAMLAVSGADRVQANGPRPALHWSRAANASDCIDPRTLAELVETFTGPVFVPAGRADLSVEGAIERSDPEHFTVRVSVTVVRGEPRGARVLSLHASTCREIDAAIAFVVATTIDPDLREQSVPGELSWLRPSETPVEEQLLAEIAGEPPRAPASPDWFAVKRTGGHAAAAPPRASAPREPEGPDQSVSVAHWELSLAASLGADAVSSPSAGVQVLLSRALAHWFSVGAQLRTHAAITRHEVDAQRSLSSQMLGVAAVGCLRSGRGARIGGQLCLGPELGWLRAGGDGFVQPHAVLRNSYGAITKLELRYALSPGLAFTAAGVLALELGRKDVEYRQGSNAHRAFDDSRYSVHAALGAAHAF